MEEEKVSFAVGDYVVLVGMLSISVMIGVYYAWKDRNDDDVDTYLVGGGQMSPIPVAISLCVSYVSGIMMVGIPTQVYFFGPVLIIWLIIAILGPFVTAVYYIPVYFRLNIASVYQLLEIRFGNTSRKLASSLVVLLMILYMGLVTFVPCLSLSAVSSMSMTWSIIITCSICTFYTTLGGIKGVIWTDVVQAGVMVLGMILVIAKTSSSVGGFDQVIEAMHTGKRDNFFNWDPNPYVKHTSWTLGIGGAVIWIMMAAINQPMVQRYLSCKSTKDAQIAAGLLLFPQVLFMGLACLTGIVMYAYFAQCDPVTSRRVKVKDQILPYMVVHLFRDTPGVAGLFISAVYSGTLSTISSGINALASVALNDYILPRKPSLKKQGLRISKILVVLFGGMVLLATFAVAAMGSLVVEVLFSAFGCIGGPLLGVYTMALFLPWCNEKGAVAGQIVGTFISMWMAVGQSIYPVRFKYLNIRPLSRAGCLANLAPKLIATTLNGTKLVTNATEIWTQENFEASSLYSTSPFTNSVMPTFNITVAPEPALPPMPPPRPAIADNFYGISSNYIGVIGFVVALLVGVVASWISGFEDPKNANTLIFTPIMDNRFLPESVRKFLRFGVPERQLVPTFDSDVKMESKTSKPENKFDLVVVDESSKISSCQSLPNGLKYSLLDDTLSETVI